MPASEPFEGDETAPPDEGEATPLRALMAEDSAISAEMMVAMAERISIELDWAENGFEAIEMIDQARADGAPYALLLVDIMMPVIDGIETARRIRAGGCDAKELPIIAITAAASREEIRTYYAAGIQAFIEKPVRLSDFRSVLRAWSDAKLEISDMAASKSFAKLEQLFHARNQHALELIEAALEDDDFGAATLAAIRSLLHQIAGTAATFGDRKLSDQASIHENALADNSHAAGLTQSILRDAAAALRQSVEKQGKRNAQ